MSESPPSKQDAERRRDQRLVLGGLTKPQHLRIIEKMSNQDTIKGTPPTEELIEIGEMISATAPNDHDRLDAIILDLTRIRHKGVTAPSFPRLWPAVKRWLGREWFEAWSISDITHLMRVSRELPECGKCGGCGTLSVEGYEGLHKKCDECEGSGCDLNSENAEVARTEGEKRS